MARNSSTYVVRTKDGIELEVDNDIRPDDPLVKHAILQQREKREIAQRQQRVAERTANEQQIEQQRFKEQEANMPWAQRALANVGAGMMNLEQGARDLFGKASDEEIKEKRRIDQQLAETTTGGGLMQLAGEVLPTVAIPAGTAMQGLRALPLAGRLLPRAGTAMSAIGDAGIMGAAQGALQATAGDESRLQNIGLGAAGGAAIPAVVGGTRRLHSALTRSGARDRAARELGDSGMFSPEMTRRTQNPRPDDIPLSTAAISQSPELAIAERASRARNPAAWVAQDEATARGVWNTVGRATNNMDDLAQHRATRQAGWEQGIENMANAVDPAVFRNEVQAFRNTIGLAQRTPQGQNQMRGVLAEIARQIDEMGDEITPQHLAALRARMSGSVKGTPLTDPFRSAPNTDPYYMSLRNELDRMLDASSGGQWSPVNAGYRANSVPVTQARASQAVRESFQTPQGIGVHGEVGGVPKVTEARLTQALKNKGESRFGDALAPRTRQGLERAREALHAQNITQRVRNAGTGGGGSNTAQDLIAAGAQTGAENITGIAIPSVVASTLKAIVKQRGDHLMNQELDRMLMDPNAYIQAVMRIQQSGRPLSVPQRQMLQLLYQSTAAAPGAAVAAQE